LPGFLFPGGDLSVFIEDVLLKTAQRS